MSILQYVLAFLAGSVSPIQSGASSELNKQLFGPIWSALFVYLSGLAGVLVVQIFVRSAMPDPKLGGALPWWAWTGGILSIASTLTGLTLAQKMGAGMFTGLSLTASVLTSVALDHFGLMGFEQHALTPLRAGGALFLLTGIWMIAKS